MSSVSQLLKPPCVRCMKPSHDAHHGRPDNLNQGKGMGGTQHDDSEHFVMLDLCRLCHDRAHDKTTLFELFDDEDGRECVRWTDFGGRTGERPLVLLESETDEGMAHAWAQAQQLGEEMVLKQADLAYRWYKRYGGHDGWWRRVADLIRDSTGIPVSVGVVYDRAAIGVFLASYEGDARDALANLGVKVAAAAGRAITAGSDPIEVIDFAEQARDAGTKMTATATAIKEEYLGAEPKEDVADIASALLAALKRGINEFVMCYACSIESGHVEGAEGPERACSGCAWKQATDAIARAEAAL